MEAAATQTSDTYQTAKSFRWIRALGEDIILHQQTILTLHHRGDNNKHWVSLVIDSGHYHRSLFQSKEGGAGVAVNTVLLMDDRLLVST
jgi:hypothetical protein